MSERLVEFLYILARDELPIGTIEGIMWDHVNGGEPDSYCNTYLEDWARDLANRLTNETLPITDWKHMYKEGSKDGKNGERFWIGIDGNRKSAPYGSKDIET